MFNLTQLYECTLGGGQTGTRAAVWTHGYNLLLISCEKTADKRSYYNIQETNILIKCADLSLDVNQVWIRVLTRTV